MGCGSETDLLQHHAPDRHSHHPPCSWLVPVHAALSEARLLLNALRTPRGASDSAVPISSYVFHGSGHPHTSSRLLIYEQIMDYQRRLWTRLAEGRAGLGCCRTTRTSASFATCVFRTLRSETASPPTHSARQCRHGQLPAGVLPARKTANAFLPKRSTLQQCCGWKACCQ